jgi:fumarate hydratase, class II
MMSSFISSNANFELNVCKPVVAYNFLQSVRLLAEAIHSFTVYCASAVEVNTARIQAALERSLVGVTALTPHIG